MDAEFDARVLPFYTELPAKDSTYVVRDIRLGSTFNFEGDVSVLLVGVRNPHAQSKAGLERGFRADRFLKLQELKDEARGRQAETKTAEQPQEVAA